MAHYFISSISSARGGVFLFESGTGALELLMPGRFRGLTFGADGWIYAVTGTRRHSAEFSTRILRLHPQSRQSEEVALVPWKGCHDLRWCRDSFYLAASIGNYVVRYNRHLEEIDRLQLVPHQQDVCHVNCLAEHQEELYASLFTLSPGTREEKSLSPAWANEGKVVKLDFTGRVFTVCHEPLAQPHSLNWRDGLLYLIESHTSRIAEIHLDSGRKRTITQLTGFARGLALGRDETVVGTCGLFRDERQRSGAIPPVTRLLERFRPFEGVLVLDPHTWAVRRKFSLPGLEPYDILPVPA